MQTPIAPKSAGGVPQPAFLGFEERLREKEAAMSVDVLEIDLDEDGPLREEYLPKRRASRIASQPACHTVNTIDTGSVGLLPPPAKWSPSGDEPIHRERTRSSGHYVAVQAPQLASAYPVQSHDVTYHQNWLRGAYMPVKHIGYAYEIPAFFGMGQSTYNSFAENATMVPPHLRSQSLSYGRDTASFHTHMQSGFGYTVSDHISEMDARWVDGLHYPYSGPAYLPLPAIGLQQSW